MPDQKIFDSFKRFDPEALSKFFKAHDIIYNGTTLHVPQGSVMLPPGPIQQARINKRWLNGLTEKGPFMFKQEGNWRCCEELLFLGVTGFVGMTETDYGCDGKANVSRLAWAETRGAVILLPSG